MRKIVLSLVCLLAYAPTVGLMASEKLIKIGDFSIDSVCPHNGYLLDDGNAYRPINKNQAKSTRDWQRGDVLMVLKAEHRDRFLMVNTRTGEKVKMKSASVKSCK